MPEENTERYNKEFRAHLVLMMAAVPSNYILQTFAVPDALFNSDASNTLQAM